LKHLLLFTYAILYVILKSTIVPTSKLLEQVVDIKCNSSIGRQEAPAILENIIADNPTFDEPINSECTRKETRGEAPLRDGRGGVIRESNRLTSG